VPAQRRHDEIYMGVFQVYPITKKMNVSITETKQNC